MPLPYHEGSVSFKITSVEKPCVTSYKIFGDHSDPQTIPLVCLHGGPGAGHEYLLPFAQLWSDYGIPVIFYDQIGCASSTHLREKAGDRGFWQASLFIGELDNLLYHLGLGAERGYHLLGHSWGGMLAAEFATRNPPGLQKLVLASALASFDLLVEGVQQRTSTLPGSAQRALSEGVESGDYGSPGYLAALSQFAAMSMCIDPDLAELRLAQKHLQEDPTVYTTMKVKTSNSDGAYSDLHLRYGSTMAAPNGSLGGWSCIPGLSRIKADTLVYNGNADSSQDDAQQPFFELIPRVRWRTFCAGHMAHLEADLQEAVLHFVGKFLTAPPMVD